MITNSPYIATCLSKSLTRHATFPTKTFLRYFGIQTKFIFKPYLLWLTFR
jgi:hypothetical protein